MAGCGLSQPDQADQGSGHQYQDGHAAGLAAAISARKPPAISPGSPNSVMAAAAAWADGTPADRCASAASSSPERSSARIPAWARAGPGSPAETSAR